MSPSPSLTCPCISTQQDNAFFSGGRLCVPDVAGQAPGHSGGHPRLADRLPRLQPAQPQEEQISDGQDLQADRSVSYPIV